MIKKKRKSNNYVFTLKGINIDKIDEKYGINLISIRLAIGFVSP